MRDAAHKAFDPIWQLNLMSRTAAYAWLAEQLGIPPEHRHSYCHIGGFDILTCQRVIDICLPVRDKLLLKKFNLIPATDQQDWSDIA